MSLGSAIKELRQARRWSMGKLAMLSGVDTSTLSRLERGERRSLRPDNLDKVARAFGLTGEELEARAMGTNPPSILGPTYGIGRDSIQALTAKVTDLQSDLERVLESLRQEVTMVPFLGSVPAGTPLPPMAAVTERIPIPTTILEGINIPGALTVSGDSMAPTLLDGWYLVLEMDPDQAIVDGQIYALQWDNQVCVKRIFRGDGQLTLVSDNPSYRPLTVREAQVLLIGRVAVWVFYGRPDKAGGPRGSG